MRTSGIRCEKREWGTGSGSALTNPSNEFEMSRLIAIYTPVLRNAADGAPTTHPQTPLSARPPPRPPAVRTRLAGDAGVHRWARAGYGGRVVAGRARSGVHPGSSGTA